MPHIFELHLEKEKSRLMLLDDKKEVASKEWIESRDMGRQLFGVMKELLEENKLHPEDVADFEIVSDLPETYTSRRIAETVKKVYTYGRGGRSI